MIPYTDNSAHVTDDFCTERRVEETVEFIGRLEGEVWDIGEPNYVVDRIAKVNLSAVLGSIHGFDFNRGTFPVWRVDAVLCLEVFEHVMNPLWLADGMNCMLRDGGVLYLSTPVRNPVGFMFNTTNHFNEYTVEAVCTCLTYAGFAVERVHTFRSIPFWKGMVKGGGVFRTFLRVISQRTMLIKAVKK